MQPVAFAGCFGWLHGGRGKLAVLLCPSVAQEAGCAYVSLRVLAERLAVAGYPSLRFDYLGTGDSADGSAGAPGPDDALAQWRFSIGAAIDTLRGLTGAAEVVLCGVRLGALLAVEAAGHRADIAGLMLLAPVIDGRAQVRELQLSSAVIWSAPPQRPGWLETDGFAFPDAMLARLGNTDLRRLAMPAAARVLILAQPGDRSGADYAARLVAAGLKVQQAVFDGFAAMVRPNGGNQVPHAAFDRVLEWMAAWPPVPLPTVPVAARYVDLVGTCWNETPFHFGSCFSLFGILCRPHDGIAPSAVIIGNTGMDPHHGYGRFHVDLARRLAARGIASLRFDFPDLGDSASPGATGPSPVYAQDRRADFAAAIAALRQQGFHRVVLAGVCSGATHAFAAAAREPAVEAVMLINPETLAPDIAPGPAKQARSARRSTRFYLHAALSGLAVRRLRAGELNPGGVAATLLRRAAARLGYAGLRAASRIGIRTAHAAPVRALRGLRRRGVRVLILMGLEEPGLDTVAAELGGAARFEIDPMLDHALSRQDMRDRVADRLIAFFDAGARANRPTRIRLRQRAAAATFGMAKTPRGQVRHAPAEFDLS